MELPAKVQLIQAGWFFLLGAALGLLYDVLGGARDRARLPAWLGDAVFALGVTAALFAGGMASLEGRPRLYMALAMLLGLALWLTAASPVSRLFFGAIWGLAARGAAILAAPVRKCGVFFKKTGKKLFSNGRKWFTIIVTHWKQTIHVRKGGGGGAISQDKLADRAGHRRGDRVRMYHPDEYADKDRQRQRD